LSQPKSSGVSFSKIPESAQRRGAPPAKIEQYTEPPESSGSPRRCNSSSSLRASSEESIRTAQRRRLSYQVYPGISPSQPYSRPAWNAGVEVGAPARHDETP